MRFAAAVAVVLILGSMALGQKLKNPVPPVRSAPGTARHSTVAPPPVTRSSGSPAAQLAKIEQQTARLRSNKAVSHAPSSNVKTMPALDLGKNKPVRAGRSAVPAKRKN
jgi:hypothetical protein